MRITLANLAEATEQQVFDQVAEHLMTQKAKSLTMGVGAETCVYRGEGGRACAAGCLISDEEFLYKIGDRKNGSAWKVLAKLGVVTHQHSDLISQLQKVHDKNEPILWKKALCNLAQRFGLSTAKLEKFQ